MQNKEKWGGTLFSREGGAMTSVLKWWGWGDSPLRKSLILEKVPQLHRPCIFYVKWSPVADSENSERRAGRFFSHLFIYSRFPITRTFKGNRKSLSYREFKSRITGNNKEISNEWGGNAIKQQSIQGWTLNLNWSDKNNKDKELTRLL